MSIVSRLFGSQQASAKTAARTNPPGLQPERDATRRQLLVTAVRDTLRTHGIPFAWMSAETLTAATAGKERGMHLRLVLRDPRLLAYAMDVQKSVSARIARLDPLSPAWVAGISWKLDAAEGASFVQLPDAGHWQRLISNPPPAAPEEAAPAPLPARAVLEQLFAQDGPLRRARQERPDFSATEPMQAAGSAVH